MRLLVRGSGEVSRGIAVLAVGVALGCSAAGGGMAEREGNPNSALAEDQATSTNPGENPAAGSPSALDGEATVAGNELGTATDGAATGADCESLVIGTESVVPAIMLLVDGSMTMFASGTSEIQPWHWVSEALIEPELGIVPALQGDIRFGFAAYAGGEDTCPSLHAVPAQMGNYMPIREAYALAAAHDGVDISRRPTAIAMNVASEQLAALQEQGPKYVLLLTSGTSHACGNQEDACGMASALLATQAAFEQGVTTLVFGLESAGQLEAAADGCDGECFASHLQNLANAGMGQPLASSAEVAECEGGAALEFSERADSGSNAAYSVAATAEALRKSLMRSIDRVTRCTFELNAEVEVENAAEGSVSLNGEPLSYGEPHGWRMLDPVTIAVQGRACDEILTGDADVVVSFPCESARVR